MSAEAFAPLVLGAGWGAVVAVTAAGSARRRLARRPAPVTEPTGAAGAVPGLGHRGPPGAAGAVPGLGHRGPAGWPGPPRHARSPVASLGAAVRRLAAAAGVPAGPPARVPGPHPDTATPPPRHPGTTATPPPRHPDTTATPPPRHPDTTADRRAGWAGLASLGLLLAAPPLAPVPLAWALASPALAARRERACDEARLHDQLPDVVDLVALTTAAGLPVGASLLALGDRPGGPLGAALGRAAARLRHGAATGEALDLVGAAGPPVRPLVDALAQHDRYGTPLLPALARVAVEARARRRQRAEEAARRLPVTLLFPLVLTTLPAFVLLTVVPLLAGALGSLSLTPP